MAQARRIKRKPVSKKNRSWSWFKDLPWGLMLVILISGAVLGMLFSGSQQDDGRLGQGLKALIEEQQLNATNESAEHATVIVETPDTAQLADFDYYQVLPDIEQVMPHGLPEGAVAARKTDGYQYYVQVASFKAHEDAEALRAKLALQGVSARTQAREVEGKGLYYRVRIGPFDNTRIAKTAKEHLKNMGQDPFIFRDELPKR